MKVKEIGNLTEDPTYGEKNDIKYCNFGIAINNPFNQEDVEFVKVSVYGKQAENCRDYLQKGSQICVEGTVNANAYLDKEEKPRASLNVTAKEVIFLNRTRNKKSQDGREAIDNAMRKSGQNQAVSAPAQPER